MFRKRHEGRRLVASIFADVAKYALTVGVLGRFFVKDVDWDLIGGIIVLAVMHMAVAFFMSPRQKV